MKRLGIIFITGWLIESESDEKQIIPFMRFCRKTRAMGTVIKTNSPRAGESKSGNDLRDEVNRMLDKFFGDTPHTTEWATSRSGRHGVVITYTDFLSEGMAKRMLEDVLPADVRFVLKRAYSDHVVSMLLLAEYKKNKIGIVDCQEGSLTTEPIWMFVHRKLSLKEMV